MAITGGSAGLKSHGLQATSSLDPCIVLRSTARAVTHLYDLVLAPTGLKSTQFIILHAIYQHSELAQWRMANLYSLSVETLSRRLAALRKLGLVRMRVGENRGERLYTLTPEGKQKVKAALPYWNRAQQRFFNVLKGPEWSLVLTAAEEICTRAKQAELARMPNKMMTDVSSTTVMAASGND
jgi:DNA-binding MarR family transcriptional regulator